MTLLRHHIQWRKTMSKLFSPSHFLIFQRLEFRLQAVCAPKPRKHGTPNGRWRCLGRKMRSAANNLRLVAFDEDPQFAPVNGELERGVYAALMSALEAAGDWRRVLGTAVGEAWAWSNSDAEAA